KHGRHSRRDRSDEYVGHASGSGPDQHDLVAVFLRRDLAAVDVEERVHGKCWPCLGVLVEIRVHLQLGIGADVQTPETDALTGYRLDVRWTQIQAARRDLQRHRRVILIVVGQHERLGTDRAVYVWRGVEMAQSSHSHAERLDDRHLDAQRRNGRTELAARNLHGVLAQVFGQILVGLANRLADAKEDRQYYIPRAAEALGQFAVGV